MRFPWTLGLVSAFSYFAALGMDWPLVRAVSKPIPVLCMAAAAVMANKSPYGRLIFAGLVLSAFGDLLLEVNRFEEGLAAFLFGHVLYVGAYVTDTRALKPLRAVPAYAFGAVALAFLGGHLGDMLVPVVVYTAIICTMLWRAGARLEPGADLQRDRWYALLGAVSFALSDTLVAMHQFASPPEAIQWAIMILYWGGQLGIAASAVIHPVKRVSPG
ncbi:MAG: lysoplasmalogenase [Myxococcota bacterium]